MITVFQVRKAGEEMTRLFLPQSAWGARCLDVLHHRGNLISESVDQTQNPDPRGAAELARRDALLDLCD